MFYANFKGFEPFGISCAEAMSFGAVPLVYRASTSGPWIDIIQQGRYGLGFSTAREFTELTERLLLDEEEWLGWSRKAVERSQCFSRPRFERDFEAMVMGG